MNIAVVGAGASGLTAAIAAARNGAKVTVFERNDKVGKKILVTGNGKCNIGNMSLSDEFYYSDDRDFIVSALERFGLSETLTFFRGLGLLITEKRGGLYPYSEQAATVLDALRFEAVSLNVNISTNSFVEAISVNKNNSIDLRIKKDIYEENLRDKKGKQIFLRSDTITRSFDKVIISTGGMAAPKTGSDGNGYGLLKSLGHTVTDICPALIGLKCKGDFWKSVSGVRCNAEINIISDNRILGSDMGELQLTDYGISGIPIFQISRIASKALLTGKKVRAEIDFMPELTYDEFIEELSIRLLLIPDRTNEQFYNGFFNKKLSMLFIKRCSLDPNACVDKKDIERIVALAKSFRVDILSDNGYEQAQVTAGGIRLSEIDNNFESKLVKGLYITGELLDADGKCGGYNLQWAWTSGYIAGEAASLC